MNDNGNEEKTSERNSLIPYEDKPALEFCNRTQEQAEDVALVEMEGAVDFDPADFCTSSKKKSRLGFRQSIVNAFSFVCIVLGFIAVFFGIGVLISGGGSESGFGAYDSAASESENQDIPVGGTPQSRPTDENISHEIPSKAVFVIDEGLSGISVNDIDTSTYSLSSLVENTDGVKIIIIHSHSSEMFSENIGIVEAGDVLGELLRSSGIGVYHERKSFDSEGVIGAYDRMETELSKLLEKYPETVCVIDLHDSDLQSPLTITVSTESEHGRSDNLMLSLAVYRRYDGVESGLRLVPSSVGQTHSRLSLHIGVGGTDRSDEEARAALAAFAEGFLRVCLSDYK